MQFPLALPTNMAGLNQTTILSLSMVVIATIIGAGGLGLVVTSGLERLNIGQAFVGGIGIVLLAMVLDRSTQGLGDKAPGVRRNEPHQAAPRGCGESDRPAGSAAARFQRHHIDQKEPQQSSSGEFASLGH